MATIFSRKDLFSMVYAGIQQLNALHDALAASGTLTDGYSSHNFHRDVSALAGGTFEYPTSSVLAITASLAVDLPTVMALANNELAILKVHVADDSAHQVKDTVAIAALAALSPAVDLPSTEALLVGMVAAYTAHRTQSGVHMNNDTFNIWSGNASDLPTSILLANFGVANINDHILSGTSVGRVKLIAS